MTESATLHDFADAIREVLGLARLYTHDPIEDPRRTREEVREIRRFDPESRPWKRREGLFSLPARPSLFGSS